MGMAGQVGPGWFPNEAMNGALHWWDGSTWAARPGVDPRLRLGQTIGDGYTVRWHPPYGWPTPPHAGWFPGPNWVPPADLPYDPTHQWWTVTNLRSGAPDPTALVLRLMNFEVSTGDLERLYALAVDPIWIAPPNWPAAPTGWTPPAGWAPNPMWGPAPDGWEFYQPDPDELELQRAQRIRLFESPVAAQMLLNRAEDCLAWSVAIRRAIVTAAEAFAGHDCDEEWASGLLELARSADELRRAVSTQRTYVLYALAQVGQFDGHFTAVRAAVVEATRQALRVSGGILSAMESPLEALEPAHLLPDDEEVTAARWPISHAVLHALTLHTELLTRLNLDSNDGSNWTPDAADWQRAEEIAAAELRSRGFASAQRTPPGADGGFDVEGRGIVAQVKYLAQPVGREVIQRLVGANLHGAQMAMFSRTGYTKQALNFAQAAQVALFLIDTNDASADPANELAEDLYG